MSSNTKTVELSNEKKLVLFLREDGKVMRVDTYVNDDLVATGHEAYGIEESEAIQKYG